MCEKCRELEKKIERLWRVAASINDQLTIDRLNRLLKDMEAEKVALSDPSTRLKATAVVLDFADPIVPGRNLCMVQMQITNGG